MSLPLPVERLLSEFKSRRPLRAGSLIITVFGDAISQHGNSVWLGSLIRILEPFGLNDRMIRTSVFRLVQDGWLQTNQIGRRSYYRFTELGLRHYESAARRIYAAQRPHWDGNWTLVLPTLLEDAERDRLRKELSWLGYGSLNSAVMAKPGMDSKTLHEALAALGYTDKVVIMHANTDDGSAPKALHQLAQSCWKLDELAQRYRTFRQRFHPVQKALERQKSIAPQVAFLTRILLIHEYRRILLKDSDLPQAILPNDWEGHLALQLTAALYRCVYVQSESYLRAEVENESGGLPAAAAGCRRRFGGF